MKKVLLHFALIAVAFALLAPPRATAGVILLANGTLTESRAGYYTDLSGLNGALENGVAANLLGGLGSGLAWSSGNTFISVPDRGPNAVSYDDLIDDTVTYIPRFHTITMNLQPNHGSGLPFTLTPKLVDTTLMYSLLPLVYGSGDGLGVGPGAPAQNTFFKHYFSGRSDNYAATHNSGFAWDGRFDPEGIRVSNNGQFLYISDEYGPYVYEFWRPAGLRLRAFALPAHLFVANPHPTGDEESADNTSGRVPNKGMEGLAITPDGRTLVGIMQNALIQDAAEGGDAKNLLRIVTIDIASGKATHEYAYLLTTGSGVSEITAINSHEFLVDERDGKGLGDGSKAKIKQIFKIDLAGAVDVIDMDGLEAAQNAVTKSLFLDIVSVLTANGIPADQIPAKLEGIALGRDLNYNGKMHTLWVANDNDFLQDYDGTNTNPNQFFVFGFTDSDLGGSPYQPQQPQP